MHNFSESLQEFCDIWKEWRLVKDSNSETYAKMTRLVEVEHGEIRVLDVHIVYSLTYKWPVLWFSLSKRDGTTANSSEVENLIKSCTSKTGKAVAPIISLNEHPHLGVLYYNIHPCGTNPEIFQNAPAPTDKINEIAQWFSHYGPDIGISIPCGMFLR